MKGGMEEGNSLKFIVLYNRKEEGYNLKSIEMTRIILAENEKSRGLEQICWSE